MASQSHFYIPTSIVLTTLTLLKVHTWKVANAEGLSSDIEPNTTITNNDDGVHQDVLEQLSLMDYALFGVFILLALELLNYLVKVCGTNMKNKRVPVRGKHLDELSSRDYLFISLNKVATPPFVYCYLRYMYYEPNAVWGLGDISWRNTLLPLPLMFIIYDFFYTIMHWALHVKSIYGYIHKHHHHQKAPSRAQVDAVNVHPIEFFLGEYDHLFTAYIWCSVFGQSLHIAAVMLFLGLGGAMASLNHTRFDVVVSFFSLTLYDTKAHDVHHRIPQSNYGQYIMFWDIIFGSYRAYNENDRVNPKAQLDEKSGKSMEYMERLNSSGVKSD
mmetsp:Transcript_10420/g.15473  ORF Transcript_10420/g.15473 Transcript_10420/m.15473 type:complete len:329 (+) Transcript_10420:40-1026(+)|eukprot:CAMPEP_0196809218 /NCGR_PEP_ID=MMETSP1362-20130617/9175_1 /TAXON_ID=163516 /ORGANISM="Leptocylindrus danicus, Strain CCMP1856" /LENGTH=328 /DNA_ID=CAMNT_0042183829 /DNA_START=36 /DNA_END=1022 /DNA_ORIENTATION=-